VFGDAVAPRIAAERTWFQVYLPSRRPLTHGVRNPIAAWLDELGAFGLRSWQKRVPERVFRQSAPGIAVFLRSLWATDGCLNAEAVTPVVRYDTSSRRLSRDVCSLLLRLGINAVLREVSMGSKGRTIHRLQVLGRTDIETFLREVGGLGRRKGHEHARMHERLAAQRTRNPNRDVVPRAVWTSHVSPAMRAAGISDRTLQRAIGTHYPESALYETDLGRERALRVAEAVGSSDLARLATSDVYWDEILSIEPAGEEDVYDLSVEGLHNFVAEDMSVHNSIEQDADLVAFIYRDEYYNDESDQQGLAEVIVSKHRNGPTDALKLSFLKRYAKFADLAAAQ
jgi:replicative DNA helicase